MLTKLKDTKDSCFPKMRAPNVAEIGTSIPYHALPYTMVVLVLVSQQQEYTSTLHTATYNSSPYFDPSPVGIS